MGCHTGRRAPARGGLSASSSTRLLRCALPRCGRRESRFFAFVQGLLTPTRQGPAAAARCKGACRQVSNPGSAAGGRQKTRTKRIVAAGNKKSPHAINRLRRRGAPEGTRTPDLLVRSQSLYPAELQAHIQLFKCKTYVSTSCGKNQALFQSFQKRGQQGTCIPLLSSRRPPSLDFPPFSGRRSRRTVRARRPA